ISLVIGLLGMVYAVFHFIDNGFDLNINIVNFIMLFLGILLHRTPRRFLHSVTHAVKNAGGIIIQFPFYARLMGMMVGSGLFELLRLCSCCCGCWGSCCIVVLVAFYTVLPMQ